MKKEMYVYEGNGRNSASSSGLVGYDVLLDHGEEIYSASFSNWERGALVCTFKYYDWRLYNRTKKMDDVKGKEVMWTLNRDAAINFAEQVVEAIKMMDEKYGRGNW